MKNCARSKQTLTETLIKKCAKLDNKKTKKVKRKFTRAVRKFKGCLSDEQKESAETLLLEAFQADTGTFTYEEGTCGQARKMRRLNTASTTVTFETTDAQQTDSNAAKNAFEAGLSSDSSGIQTDGDMTVTVEEEEVLVIDDGTDTTTEAALNGSTNHAVFFSNIVILATALIGMVW